MWRQRIVAHAKSIGRALMIVGLLGSLAGCIPSLSGPQRLVSVQDETAQLKHDVGYVEFARYAKLSEVDKIVYRNELVGMRMYAIDIQYYDYETKLTHERQESDFLAQTAAIGLNTTSTLVPVTQTKNLLTGLSTAVTGTQGAYNSDVLLSKTIQIIQDQMRGNRAHVATRILSGLKLSSTDYSLARALSDLEEYYQAGTITAGLIAAQRTVSDDAQASEATKDAIIVNTTYLSDVASTKLRAYIYPNGKYSKENAAKLNTLLAASGFRNKQANGKPWFVQAIIYGTSTAAARLELLTAAQSAGYIQ